MSRVSPPPASDPVLDGVGLSWAWRSFIEQWWKRTGGTRDVAITDASLKIGNLTLAMTSDTNFRVTFIGSDGVTRTANLTLA